MSNIHPTAIIAEGAVIADDVTVGPHCTISSGTTIGAGSTLHSHVVIDGIVTLGEGNEVFPFCTIGTPPQDLGYKGEDTRVEIGNNNIFREYVSIHRGTRKEEGVTRIGSDGFFMNHVHFGHDTVTGDHCIFVNGCQLGGHVRVGDKVTLGGGSMVQQFCHVGDYAYIGGGSVIAKDIPPFVTAYGNRILLKGINIIGLKRGDFEREEIKAARDFYDSLSSTELTLNKFLDQSEERFQSSKLVSMMIEAIKKSKNGIPKFERV